MIEFIVETPILYLLKYPGAIVRYAFFSMLGRKEKYSYYLEGDTDLNITVATFLLVIIVLFFLIFK